VEYEKTEDRLTVALQRDFNLFTAARIETLAADCAQVRIDMSASKIVDSEAVSTLYRLLSAGKAVHLVDPPPLFFEVLEVLGLADYFAQRLTIRERAQPEQGASRDV
jgi:anti-anti-sigma regulatory factor